MIIKTCSFEAACLLSFLYCWSHVGRLELEESLLEVLPCLSNLAKGSAKQAGCFWSPSLPSSNSQLVPLVDWFCEPLRRKRLKFQMMMIIINWWLILYSLIFLLLKSFDFLPFFPPFTHTKTSWETKRKEKKSFPLLCSAFIIDLVHTTHFSFSSFSLSK